MEGSSHNTGGGEVTVSRWVRARYGLRVAWRSVDFLLSNEVYTWASAIAFNALLCFFPLIILLHALARNAGNNDLAEHVLFVLKEYLPVSQDFIAGTLRKASQRLGAVSIVSAFIVAFSSVGIFVPVEIALNRIWRVEKERHWTGSLVIAYGLTFLCTVLFAIPVYISWLFSEGLEKVLFFLEPGSYVFTILGVSFLRLVTFPVTVLVFFLCYYVLPARRIAWRDVLPAAIFTGVLWEVSRFIYNFALPYFDFEQYYGAFFVTMSLVTFALFSAMLMLFGAYLTHQNLLPKNIPPELWEYVRRKRSAGR